MPTHESSLKRSRLIRFDTELIAEDMAARGWGHRELSQHAEIGMGTVSRFLSGELQTNYTAKKIAAAFGYSTPRRYLIRRQREVA